MSTLSKFHVSIFALFGWIATSHAFIHPIPSLVCKPAHVTNYPNDCIHHSPKTYKSLAMDDNEEGNKNGELDLSDYAELEDVKSTETSISMENQVMTEASLSSSEEPPMDPLIASLTSPGPPPKEGTKTTNIPLLGEIPIDGSLLVLAPAAVIAVVGFLASIVVGINSRDAIVDTLTTLNPPPPKASVVVPDGTCRGICSTQQEDLDGLRALMESISNRKVNESPMMTRD